MQRIILHIGHHKTGTSALQSFLARNAAALRAQDVYYPDNPGNATAAQNKISIGNITPTGDWLNDQVVANALQAPDASTVVYSCEALCLMIADKIEEIARLKDHVDITLVLVVRDVFEQLQSVYQQVVKRAGYFGELSDLAMATSSIEIAADIVRKCQDFGVAINVLNYSTHKHDIIEQVLRTFPNGDALVAALAGLDKSAIVNRSMTFSELNLLSEINRLGETNLGMLVSDRLVNELPDITPELVPVDPATCEILVERLGESVRYINGFLPTTDQLTLEYAADIDAGPAFTGAHFSAAQLRIIAECMHEVSNTQMPPALPSVEKPGPRRRVKRAIKRFFGLNKRQTS